MRVLYWLMGLDAPASIRGATDWWWYAASPLPFYALVGIGVLALLVAGLNLLPQNIMPWGTRFALTLLRLVAFGLLAGMLCRMEVRVDLHRDVRPRVAILTDTSGSMALKDAGGRSRLEAAREFAARHLEPLGSDADLAAYDFSWTLEESRAGREPSNITRLMPSIASVSERERHLQAIVVLTDGNDTAGDRGQLLAPVLRARHLPVYPVVFGQAAKPRLARVRFTGGGAYVRLGDELRLSALLTADELEEQVVAVRIYQDNTETPLASRENIRLGKEPVPVDFVVKPTAAGARTYRIVMEGVGAAVAGATLVAEHSVEVIDARIKVLYVDIPRDERKILGHWLARDPVVDLATLTMMPQGGWYAQGNMLHKNAGDGLPNGEEDLYRYDVIILGDIPRAYFRAGGDVAETKLQRLAEFVGRRGGGLITLGGRSVYAAGQYQDSALSRILPFSIEATQDDPQVPRTFAVDPTPAGLAHPLMQLEFDGQLNREAWLDLPSIDGCNRVGPAKPGATLLAVRHVEEGVMPVMAVQNVGKGQVLALAIDSTWRWEFMRPDEGEDYYRRFWGNAVRALAPDPRLHPHEPQIVRYASSTPVGQTVTLATRLVDTVFKPLREAELDVKVTSPSGRVTRMYPRDGREAPGLYEYDVTLDEPGTWEVATTHKDKTAVERITAGDSHQEMDDPRAMPDTMAEFARASGGASFTPEQAAQLAQKLQLAPRDVRQTVAVALWNLPAVLLLFVSLVCIDCFIRKRRGMV